jgi:hypothetical protein
MAATSDHRSASSTTGALLKITAAWFVFGAVASLIYASVKGEGVGSFIYLIWGIAVSFSGTLSHGLLICSKWFCRSIGFVQVLSIASLAIALFFMFLLLGGATSIGPETASVQFFLQVLPYMAPPLFVVAIIVNMLFTPD